MEVTKENGVFVLKVEDDDKAGQEFLTLLVREDRQIEVSQIEFLAATRPFVATDARLSISSRSLQEDQAAHDWETEHSTHIRLGIYG
jgi:hypothetical protein